MSANTDLSDSSIESVKNFLQGFQAELCDTLAGVDGEAEFSSDNWRREQGGGGITRTLVGGAVFEKAGVGFSEVYGDKLPPSATAKRPELAGRKWRAMGVSLVIHPLNPHVPVSHANVRLFVAEKAGENPIWWFGGGFDLTPCYGYDEDCVLWHQAASDACAPFGEHLYDELKKECDDYFFLKHRGETRGIGGLFYDDYTAGDFDQSFAFMQSVAAHYLKAYVPIVNKRKDTPYSAEQKQFQCYRRGRYVEFNLVFDRGTLFGLQSGGRTESILMSMPPEAHWQYGFTAAAGSDEEKLVERYLRPQDWLNM